MKTPQAVSALVQRGAMMVPVIGGSPVPVGFMQQLPDGRWFWWAAGGYTEFDRHVIDADKVNVLYDGLAVEFLKSGQMIGYLTTIEESLDDPAGAEQVGRIIRQWRSEYDRNPSLRGFIVREMNTA
jgi:hypothetical protein